MSQYDESERGTMEPKTARDTVSHSKRKGESLVPELNSALKGNASARQTVKQPQTHLLTEDADEREVFHTEEEEEEKNTANVNQIDMYNLLNGASEEKPGAPKRSFKGEGD